MCGLAKANSDAAAAVVAAPKIPTTIDAALLSFFLSFLFCC